MRKILFLLFLFLAGCNTSEYHVTCYSADGTVVYEGVLNRGPGFWRDETGNQVFVPDDSCVSVPVEG